MDKSIVAERVKTQGGDGGWRGGSWAKTHWFDRPCDCTVWSTACYFSYTDGHRSMKSYCHHFAWWRVSHVSAPSAKLNQLRLFAIAATIHKPEPFNSSALLPKENTFNIFYDSLISLPLPLNGSKRARTSSGKDPESCSSGRVGNLN